MSVIYADRAKVKTIDGELLSLQNFVDHVLTSKITWDALEKIMKVIHNVLRYEDLRKKLVNNNPQKLILPPRPNMRKRLF